MRARLLTLSDNTRGALWLLLAAGSFSGMNGLIKYLGATIPSIEIIFYRGLFGLVVLVPFMIRQGRACLVVQRPWMHVLRAALGLGAMASSFTALGKLTMASAVSFFFAKPLFVILLAALVLKERIRWRRSVATVVGFCGVLIMLRPWTGEINGWALLAVGSAFLMASVMIALKAMTASETPFTMVLWFTIASTIFALPPSLLVWVPPSTLELALLAGVGGLGSLGQYFLVRAYHVGEATVVTPMDYSQIVFAGLIGFFGFGEVPDAWTAIGAVVVAGSSLYILRREGRIKGPLVAQSVLQAEATEDHHGEGQPQHREQIPN